MIRDKRVNTIDIRDCIPIAINVIIAGSFCRPETPSSPAQERLAAIEEQKSWLKSSLASQPWKSELEKADGSEEKITLDTVKKMIV